MILPQPGERVGIVGKGVVEGERGAVGVNGDWRGSGRVDADTYDAVGAEALDAASDFKGSRNAADEPVEDVRIRLGPGVDAGSVTLFAGEGSGLRVAGPNQVRLSSLDAYAVVDLG